MMPLKLEGEEQGEATKGSLSTPRMRHATMPGRKAHGRSRSKCLECSTRLCLAERPTAGREANALNAARDYAWLKGPLQVAKQMP
eukprot:2947955-Rhodomonas_salina.1